MNKYHPQDESLRDKIFLGTITYDFACVLAPNASEDTKRKWLKSSFVAGKTTPGSES